MIEFLSVALETHQPKFEVNLDARNLFFIGLAVVATDVNKSRLAFVDECLKVKSQVYLNTIAEKSSSLVHRSF